MRVLLDLNLAFSSIGGSGVDDGEAELEEWEEDAIGEVPSGDRWTIETPELRWRRSARRRPGDRRRTDDITFSPDPIGCLPGR